MLYPFSMRSSAPIAAMPFRLRFLFVIIVMAPLVLSFQPSLGSFGQLSSTIPSQGRLHSFPTANYQHRRPRPSPPGRSSSTSLNMFMGSDGGVLGIGTPELFTILLVGYFVLGPSDLYALVKEVGKFVQNVRTLGTEATKTLEDTMESQIELKEIRRAQQELNEAFSFRRSINVDQEADVFTNTAAGPQEEVTGMGVPESAVPAAASAGAATEAPKKKKKKRRRAKKKQPAAEPEDDVNEGSIPDLDMNENFPDNAKMSKEESDWSADGDGKFPSAAEMAAKDREWLGSADSTQSPSPVEEEPADPAAQAAEQSRFQQQLNGNWNQMVLENEDELEPLAMVMNKLALLEEERAAAERRLEDEFRERFKLEEEYYQKKREVLEETATQVQKDAYVTMDSEKSKSKST